MNGLEAKHSQKLSCDVINARTEESQKKIKELGLGSHGLVVYDAAGNVASKIPGHKMSIEEVEKAVEPVL